MKKGRTTLRKEDTMVKEFDALPKKKKNKKGFKKTVNAVVDFLGDLIHFVFFATAIAGGYVLFTQGSVTMKVVGGILLAGGVTYFADKSIRK